MSVTSTSTIHSTTTAATAVTTNATQTQTGLSSVGSSISSAASTDSSCDIFSCVCAPFRAIANLFARLQNYVASFFPETDKTRITFIEENLNALTGEVYEEALDKFSHIFDTKTRIQAFKMIQNSPDTSALTVRAFYDLLPVDAQNHLERHIWIENGRNDNGQGLQFGKTVINSNIKAELVTRALEQCLVESK